MSDIIAVQNENNEDKEVIDIFKYDPDFFARQITLKDLSLFKAICPDELTSCAWSSKHKLTKTPNIVASTRQFNQINFWVQKEVLSISHSSTKRADVLSYFIRVAKRLFEYNNLQSCRAILAGLQSAAIYRLSQTWSKIRSKDRYNLENLNELFSEDNNKQNLRIHMDKMRLPCIPYLGMYLGDLFFIDSAYPSTGGMDSQNRQDLMNNILRVIADYQESEYAFELNSALQKYLDMDVYIEEFQVQMEETNYKLSLSLEPPPQDASSDAVVVNGYPETVAVRRRELRSEDALNFGHRKSKSLGNFDSWQQIIASQGQSSNQVGSLGRNAYGQIKVFRKNLLDDSIVVSNDDVEANISPGVCIETDQYTQVITELNCPSTDTDKQNGHVLSEPRSNSFVSSTKTHPIVISKLICEGCLKRKTRTKDGRKPAIANWTRYWVSLVETQGGNNRYLLYYPSKYRKSLNRNDFRSTYSKHQCIDGCLVMEPTLRKSYMQLVAPDNNNIYKFKVPFPASPHQPSIEDWISYIRTGLDRVDPSSGDLIKFNDT